MDISLTKEQLRDLVYLAELGRFIRERSSDVPEAELDSVWQNAIEPLLATAKASGMKDIIEEHDGKTIIANDILAATDEAVADYDDETFWFELESRLGERDFYAYGNDAEIEESEKSGKLPDRVEWYYRKYRKEFDENGIDRLEISEEF